MGGNKYNMITVLGHTAGGKTVFAVHLAFHLQGEIISADSRQVYRGMDIGTGKDYEDYNTGGKKIPYHLIDIVDAGYEYNVYEFQNDFSRIFMEITGRGRLPVMCGGSGLYIESVLRNYRLLQVPVNEVLRKELENAEHHLLVERLKKSAHLHNITDITNRNRLIRAIEIAEYQSRTVPGEPVVPRINSLVLGIKFDRNSRRERITGRLKKRLDKGLVEEVRGLMKQGISSEKLYYYGLEYRIISRFIMGEIDFNEMFSTLNTAIHRFAKRQMTYFRGMERRGVEIHWLNGEIPLEERVQVAMEIFRTT